MAGRWECTRDYPGMSCWQLALPEGSLEIVQSDGKFWPSFRLFGGSSRPMRARPTLEAAQADAVRKARSLLTAALAGLPGGE